MTSWKELALSGYYLASLPVRRRAAAERAERHIEPVRILFYHRVADTVPNSWTMRKSTFARQIEWLSERLDIVTLSDAQHRLTTGNAKPAACITFDDGYADNCEFAIPLLLERKIPFTYFVSTNHVLRGESFPHDVAGGKPLAVNTIAQLRDLAVAGVEIGAHTRSHANLGASKSRDELTDEIVGSKQDLEDAVGVRIRYFAFPYGLHANLSAAAFQVAYKASFSGVCSAYGGYNFPGDDPFHLRRFHADEEFVRFKNWMTVDPRKVRMQYDFDPGNFRSGLVSRKDAKAQSEDLLELLTTN